MNQPDQPMLTSRRAFLAGTLAAAGVALLDPRALAAARTRAALLPAGDLFPLGVASGDPIADGVILWTRILSPMPATPLPDADIAVDWEVATDQAFTTIVATGTAPAVAALGHSVHVDVTGLAPDTVHWYRFTADARTSPVGRTKTFPDPTSTPAKVTFAVATCQNWSDGYYTAYENMALEDLDLVVFVGDYIYESSANRQPRPLTLPRSEDIPTYRARYELYKGDPNLQAAHQAFPWILTVDDHEVANDMVGDFGSEGAGEGDPAAIAAFRARRADAYQVWYEHQPLRLDAPSGPDFTLHRMIEHSALLRFFVLDGRQYRSHYPNGKGIGTDADAPERNAPSQTMLGLDQEAWLDDQFAATDAQWNVITQQTVMTAMPIPAGSNDFYNFDQWDGYVAARNRLLHSLVDHRVRNPMVLSGDIHLAAMTAVRVDYDDPDAPDVANEVVTTSISSRFDSDLLDLFEAGLERATWVRYGNGLDRGYARITVTPTEWTTDFRVVASVTQQSSTVRTDFSDVVADRDPVVLPVDPTPTTTVPQLDEPTATAPGATPLPGSASFTG
ncbi:MAG: Alkaline phosphatase [Acidimicrobiales bacterium]|nr:Alkaline phosphatase [Acidimicrobiales bacterium]